MTKRLSIFLITVALIAGMVGCGGDGDDHNPLPQNLEIRDWYDLDEIRDNLGGNHTLMNNLDSSTLGYEQLASPTANGGKGWQPIGEPQDNPFAGTFDGQGYEICDLFINRRDEGFVGLFGIVNEGGCIKDIGVVNVDVTGRSTIGGLVGLSEMGTIRNSYSTGSVTGNSSVGGLVGFNERGTVSKCYSSGNVTSWWNVGGLVATSTGLVSNSYSTSSVTGSVYVGGLMAWNAGNVSNSHSTGRVTGDTTVGGLMAYNAGNISNSYFIGSVAGEDMVGGLVGFNHYGIVSNSYSTGSVAANLGVGGLVAYNYHGIVSNSFWDTQTSGQSASYGGTGKTSAEMKNITTFSTADWNIVAVANPGTRNPSYTWNIVDGQTYPFLSWESVS